MNPNQELITRVLTLIRQDLERVVNIQKINSFIGNCVVALAFVIHVCLCRYAPDEFMYLLILLTVGVIACKLMCYEISIYYNLKKLVATEDQKILYSLLLRRKKSLKIPTEADLYQVLEKALPFFYEQHPELLSKEASDLLLLGVFYGQWLIETIPKIRQIPIYHKPIVDLLLE